MANAGGKHFKPKDAPTAGSGGARAPRPANSQLVPPSPYARTTHAVQPAARSAQAAGGRQGGSTSPAYRAPRGGKSDRSGKGSRNILSNILIVVGVALLLVAGGLFVKAQIGYKRAAEYYDSMSKTAIKDSSGEDDIPQIDFDALKKTSEDVVGWIYIPGTRVNYVVAQGETNKTYLRHLLSGEYSDGGTIFMDMDNTAPGMVDQQTTIYGHHMNDGSMFKVIDETRDQDSFDAIEKVYYITPEATYVLEPLFTMQVQDDYVDARRVNFDNDKAFTQYLQASLAQAQASSEDAAERVEHADKVLTLVTCAGEIIPRTTRAAMVCDVVETIPAE